MESSAQKEQNKIDQKRADRAADKRDKYQLAVFSSILAGLFGGLFGALFAWLFSMLG